MGFKHVPSLSCSMLTDHFIRSLEPWFFSLLSWFIPFFQFPYPTAISCSPCVVLLRGCPSAPVAQKFLQFVFSITCTHSTPHSCPFYFNHSPRHFHVVLFFPGPFNLCALALLSTSSRKKKKKTLSHFYIDSAVLPSRVCFCVLFQDALFLFPSSRCCISLSSPPSSWERTAYLRLSFTVFTRVLPLTRQPFRSPCHVHVHSSFLRLHLRCRCLQC